MLNIDNGVSGKIWNLTRLSEYPLHGGSHGPSWKRGIGLVMPSVQNRMILRCIQTRRISR